MINEEQAIEQLESLAIPEKKRYSMEEFERLKKFLEENKKYFIFEPYGGMWGFALNIYRHPPYPGTNPIEITRVSGNKIPEELRIEEGKAPGRKLDDGMCELTPFSHTVENNVFLKKYRLEEPHNLSHYEY